MPLSLVLTASVLFPNITGSTIVEIPASGSILGAATEVLLAVQARRNGPPDVPHGRRPWSRTDRSQDEHAIWRMPSLSTRALPVLSTQRTIGLLTLRGYLVVVFVLVAAVVLVVVNIVQTATSR